MIVLCDPILTPHKKHLNHLMEWYAYNKIRHDLCLWMEVGRPLQKVQANAVAKAIEHGASHVLFTEHDHWGYPLDGLDVLLEADKDVVGIQTYQRAYPFLPMCMKLVNPELGFLTNEKNLKMFHPTEKLEKTDLITWAFTLVKTDVFVRLRDAGMNPWVWDTHPTDSHFCECCKNLGIDRWVSSEAVIGHGEVPLKHVPMWRRATESVRYFDKANISVADEDHTEFVDNKTEAMEVLS